MNNENNRNNNIEQILKNKKIKITITNTENEEYEYQCLDNNDNKNKLNMNFSSIPHRNSQQQLHINQNNKINNSINPIKNDKNINENNLNLFNFTNTLYSNDEHLKQTKIFPKRNSFKYTLLSINKFLRINSSGNKIGNNKIFYSKLEENTNKNYLNDSKISIDKKMKSSQLFLNDSKISIDKKMRSSQLLNKISNDKSPTNNKNKNNIISFLKLKEKNKIPPKTYYIDKIIKNIESSKINTHNNNQKNMFNEKSQRSIKPIDIKSENIIIENKDIRKEKDTGKEKEKNEIVTKLITNIGIEENKITKKEENKCVIQKIKNKTKNYTQKKKRNPFKLFCCLNDKLDNDSL